MNDQSNRFKTEIHSITEANDELGSSGSSKTSGNKSDTSSIEEKEDIDLKVIMKKNDSETLKKQMKKDKKISQISTQTKMMESGSSSDFKEEENDSKSVASSKSDQSII